VAEDHRLPGAPILEVDLRAVLRGEVGHGGLTIVATVEGRVRPGPAARRG
jgi:hypothetical protein